MNEQQRLDPARPPFDPVGFAYRNLVVTIIGVAVIFTSTVLVLSAASGITPATANRPALASAMPADMPGMELVRKIVESEAASGMPITPQVQSRYALDEAAAKTLAALGGRTHIHDNFIYALGDRRHIEHHGFSLRCRCQTLPPAPCQSLV